MRTNYFDELDELNKWVDGLNSLKFEI